MKHTKSIIAILLLALVFMFAACASDKDEKNAADVIVGETNEAGIPQLSWSASSSSEVRIIDGGLHPKSKTISFDFGYNTQKMKKDGYSTLEFTLQYSVFVDKGLNVTTTINLYFTDENKQEFGVNKNNLTYTSTSPIIDRFTTTINIEKLLQNKGKIYLTFEAVSNSFQTGTHISDIQVTVIAK